MITEERFSTSFILAEMVQFNSTWKRLKLSQLPFYMYVRGHFGERMINACEESVCCLSGPGIIYVHCKVINVSVIM